MEANSPNNMTRLAAKLEEAHSGNVFLRQFELAFGYPTSSGCLLYSWSFIQETGTKQWNESPPRLLVPKDLTEDSERPPMIGNSLLLGVLDTDQPIVLDFSFDPVSVRALVANGSGVSWRTLASSIDGFLDALA